MFELHQDYEDEPFGKIKSQERLQTIIISTRGQLQISKLQKQHKALSGYYLYLSSTTYFTLGVNPLKVNTYVCSDIDTDTSRL